MTTTHDARTARPTWSARAQRFMQPSTRIWFVVGCVAAMACVAIAATYSLPARSEGIVLPVWLLIAAFFAVESFPIHLHHRREATSFSLYELPAVLGLYFAPASVLLIAVAVGSVAALVFVRRQRAVKVLFNGANLLLQTATSLFIFDLVIGATAQPTAPIGVVAAVFATLAGSMVSVASIAVIVWAAEGVLSAAKTAEMFSFASIVSVANVSVALIAVKLGETAGWTILLLGLPLFILFASYRAFAKERSQREQVQFLFKATRALQTNLIEDDSVAVLLRETASMFRASRVELLLFDEAEVVDEAIRYSLHEEEVAPSALGQHSCDLARIAANRIDGVTLASASSHTSITKLLDTFGVGSAMIAPLGSESKVAGLLLVADRLGVVSSFASEDLALFRTLAQHTATALENNRLGQALTRQRTLERELSHLATHDPLTGLPNRLLLRQHLDEVIGEGGPIELLFIDLDNFKLVNDSLGHGTGDLVLQEVGRRITQCLGPTDLAARLGGDEFAIAVHPSGRGTAVANKILEQVRKPISADGHVMSVDCSVGIARATGLTESADLLQRADVAMYEAKRSGKGRLTTYRAALGRELAEQQERQQRLYFARRNNELLVHYQPIFDLGSKDRRAVGAEALVRWQTKDGVKSAETFLQIAEESGLIVQIDRWVFGQVLRDVLLLVESDASFDWVTVNVSARSLQEQDVVEFICTSVADAGISPSKIMLEVTETAALIDFESTIMKLQALRDVGFGIALDDFGTGYSSINYLRRMPVTLVKIAQPFIDGIAIDNGEDFLQAILDLVHRLGLPVVGEGIEQPNQLRSLESMACDLGQGYLLARPQPLEDIRPFFVTAADAAKRNAKPDAWTLSMSQ